MSKTSIVDDLVETRINGNSISNNITYKNMLKRVSKEEINEYATEYGMSHLFGTKVEMIEQIKEYIVGNRRE